jgi:hypothetical protein
MFEYIGFIQKDADIYVVFHANTDLIPKLKTWAILHEIINSQKIKNVPINPLLQSFFLENPELLYIKDQKNVPIDIPYLLYPLISAIPNTRETEKAKLPEELKQPQEEPIPPQEEQEPPQEESEEQEQPKTQEQPIPPQEESEEQEQPKTQEQPQEQQPKPQEEQQNPPGENGGKPQGFLKKWFGIGGSGNPIAYKSAVIPKDKPLLLPHKINHPKYGFFYYFSNDILNESDIENIPRYVVFIVDCKYIVDPNIPLNEDDVYSSIYFQNEEKTPLWCVTSSDFFARIE